VVPSFQVDVFEIEAVDLLDINKVIIGHDGIEGGAGCFLEKVVVYTPNSDGVKVSTFHCSRYVTGTCAVALVTVIYLL